MNEILLEEKVLSVDEYLALFDQDTVDYKTVQTRSAKIKRITVRRLQRPDGVLFEDTVFEENEGLSYTVRARL